jgi:hypothetical protein
MKIGYLRFLLAVATVLHCLKLKSVENSRGFRVTFGGALEIASMDAAQAGDRVPGQVVVGRLSTFSIFVW